MILFPPLTFAQLLIRSGFCDCGLLLLFAFFCVLPRFIIVIHIRRTAEKKKVVLVVACPSARLVSRCCFCACRVRHNKNLFQKLKKKREMRIKLPEIRAIQFAVSFSLRSVVQEVGGGAEVKQRIVGHCVCAT